MPGPLLVSIVVPSLNSGRFLAQSLESLLAQDYRNLEIIVRDGESTDETLGILKGYEGRIRWVSQKDGGAAEALRRGFESAQGEILGWLSADDLLEPWAVRKAVESLGAEPGLVAAYGDGEWIDEAGLPLGKYPTREFNFEIFSQECFICQPACFFRADAYRKAGGIDPKWNCCFDYDLWIRLARTGGFRHVPEAFAYSRMHRSNKTLGQRGVVFLEGMKLLHQHFGYVPHSWVHSYICFQEDGRDQFFEPHVSGTWKKIRTLPEGLKWNRKHPWRFVYEWLYHTPISVLIKRFGWRSPAR